MLVSDASAQWGNRGQSSPAQAQPLALAQSTPPSLGTSRGENFSAGKPPAQLFASDCTGAGCHRGPQGLAKDRGAGSLAGFLREHYTNSRESAAALAGYLVGVPGAAARPDAKPARAAARPEEAPKPPEDVSRTRKPVPAETGEPPKPAAAEKPPRGRQAIVAPAPPASAAAPEPPAPPPEPPKPQWDIFD